MGSEYAPLMLPGTSLAQQRGCLEPLVLGPMLEALHWTKHPICMYLTDPTPKSSSSVATMARSLALYPTQASMALVGCRALLLTPILMRMLLLRKVIVTIEYVWLVATMVLYPAQRHGQGLQIVAPMAFPSMPHLMYISGGGVNHQFAPFGGAVMTRWCAPLSGVIWEALV